MNETVVARPKPRLFIIGDNPARLWGMSARERIQRMARAEALSLVNNWAKADLIADARYAFDPIWLRHIAANPGTVLTLDGQPVLAHISSCTQARIIVQDATVPLDLTEIPAERATSLANAELRKRETPFVMPVRPDTVRTVERASYSGAYKGVTDLLTKYLWPEWALMLTRLAARIGLSPNMVTAIGFLFCVTATWAFFHGHYWIGMLTGLIFMVLDTVDGKLARCTITSSKLGNALDHGLDLIHPPIWWWAWAMGLGAYGTPLPASIVEPALIAIFAAYVLQRLIEGAFIAGFRMHIHVWRPIDSHFRLITARRNPNMLLLFVFLVLGRPDWGLIALAAWSLLSCVFHIVRLLQAWAVTLRGRPVVSWLA